MTWTTDMTSIAAIPFRPSTITELVEHTLESTTAQPAVTVCALHLCPTVTHRSSEMKMQSSDNCFVFRPKGSHVGTSRGGCSEHAKDQTRQKPCKIWILMKSR